jgi:hypothetical protein
MEFKTFLLHRVSKVCGREKSKKTFFPFSKVLRHHFLFVNGMFLTISMPTFQRVSNSPFIQPRTTTTINKLKHCFAVLNEPAFAA